MALGNPGLEAKSLFNNYYYELAGIELGLKKASLLPISRQELPFVKDELERRGYYYAVSDFSFSPQDSKFYSGNSINKGTDFSVYIAKDFESCERLKELEYRHAFQEKNHKFKDCSMEIGEILGYPKCCSEFLSKCRENGSFTSIIPESSAYYQDETRHSLLALQNSKRILYQLNNFDMAYPKLFSFHLCSYDCSNALEIASRLLAYMHKKFPEEHTDVIRYLKSPLLFFSSDQVIHLEGGFVENGSIHYSGCYYLNMLKGYMGSSSRRRMDSFLSILLLGNRIEVGDSSISVFMDEKKVSLIPKAHRLDGVFIKPY